jgi:catalase-peroxidase
MGMNDIETVALIAGGHTFGKAHGAAEASKYVGAEPEGAPMNQMGVGWKSSFLSGKGRDSITSGLEGAWTANPTKWDSGYFHLLFKYDWTQSKSPGGATQWVPTMESINANGGLDAVANVPDAHVQGMKHLPIMFTTDLALRYDPMYGPISKHFHQDQDKLTDAFKKAWYKLCHRDMGPTSRHLGPYLPKEPPIWLDPIPSADYDTITTNDVRHLQSLIIDAVKQSTVSISDLVKAAWASASTYRFTDHRGGANGGRIRFAPQINWEVNDPVSLAKVISFVDTLKESFNEYQKQNNRTTRVSFADLIILAGNTAIEEAAREAGHSNVRVPFVAGRTDALQSDTDVVSFAALEPSMDGFRNYEGKKRRPEASLIDRAHLLTLTTPEMVVLLGGLRVLNANTDQELVGVLTDRPGTLDNAFFINLLDENTTWLPVSDGKYFRGNRPAGEPWTASRVDLVFGSNAQLRAVCEAYACADSNNFFLHDFVSSWTKVTMLDRFDLLPTFRADSLRRHSSKL